MNQKKRAKPGSATLTVLLVMSAIIFCGLTLFKSTALTADLVLLRQEREQKMRATQGVLNYGIELCAKRFDTLTKQAQKKKKEWKFPVGKWPLNEEMVYDGLLTIVLEGQRVQLTAELVDNGSVVFGLECALEQKTKGKSVFFEVQNWKEKSSLRSP